jgi:hypothetical protein
MVAIKRERLPNRRLSETFVASIALQFGANVETIRRALCRDSRGRASGPLGAALDRIAADEAPR